MSAMGIRVGSIAPHFGAKLLISRIQHEDGTAVTSLNGDVQTYERLEEELNQKTGEVSPIQARLAQLVDDYVPGEHVQMTSHPIIDPDYSHFVPVRLDTYLLTGPHAKPFEAITPRFNQLLRQVFDMSTPLDLEAYRPISKEMAELNAQATPLILAVWEMPRHPQTLQVTVRESSPEPHTEYTDVEVKGLDLVG